MTRETVAAEMSNGTNIVQMSEDLHLKAMTGVDVARSGIFTNRSFRDKVILCSVASLRWISSHEEQSIEKSSLTSLSIKTYESVTRAYLFVKKIRTCNALLSCSNGNKRSIRCTSCSSTLSYRASTTKTAVEPSLICRSRNQSRWYRKRSKCSLKDFAVIPGFIYTALSNGDHLTTPDIKPSVA
jgi:hypothetical protein